MNTNEEIGKRIATLRKSHNLTQQDLAEKIAVSSKHLSEVERGIKKVSLDMQVAICSVFHCSQDYLINGHEYEPSFEILPDSILEILRSSDKKEQALLKEYLNFYTKLRKK